MRPKFRRHVATGFHFCAIFLVGRFQQIVHAADGFGIVAGYVLNPTRAASVVHVQDHAARPGSEIQRASHPVLRVPDGLIHRHQLVVIPLQDGIELVIVAARATNGHAQGRRQARLHSFLLRVEVLVNFVNSLIVGDVSGRSQETSCGQRLDLVWRGPRARLVIYQLVAGQLLDQKQVNRFVPVEGVDHVVSIFPGNFAIGIPGVAAGIGIACHVQPVASPLLAVVRRSQQAIDQGFPGIRRFVLDECFHLSRSGR